jgi:hypothetical protein
MEWCNTRCLLVITHSTFHQHGSLPPRLLRFEVGCVVERCGCCAFRGLQNTHNSLHPVLAAQDRRTHTAILPCLLFAISPLTRSPPRPHSKLGACLSRRRKQPGAGQREQEVLTLELQPAPTLGRNEHVELACKILSPRAPWSPKPTECKGPCPCIVPG